MAKLDEFAKDYVPPKKTKNIAELKEVPMNLEMEDDEFEAIDKETKEVKTVKQKVVFVDGEKYRVPMSVVQQLKVILTDNPNITKFKVIRTGSTIDDTRYQVIPLM